MELNEYLSRFEVIATFKSSGQKDVYLAEHPNYGKVVLKVAKFFNEACMKRAEREVEIQRSINSEYYPQIKDFLIFANHKFVIVEELIEGFPLSEKLTHYNSPIDVLQLLEKLVCGLNLLWSRKTTHRDIKPENIIIRPTGLPVIIDLGIVLVKNLTTITSPYAFYSPCTPNYAAPEQLKNRRAQIDYRTDEFILGIGMMQLLLNGVHPFDPKVVQQGDSIPFNILHGAWHKSFIECETYAPIRGIIQKLLQPEPFMRYRLVADLLKDIYNALEEYNDGI